MLASDPALLEFLQKALSDVGQCIEASRHARGTPDFRVPFSPKLKL